MHDMVRKNTMSRWACVCLAILLCLPCVALAADADPAREIVYRTNLGRVSDVNLLLKNGASPNQTDENGTPILSLACNRQDKEGMKIITALLEAGANVDGLDAKGQTPLFYAAKRGNKELVALLLEKGADYYKTDKNGDLARNIAFRAGYKDIVEQLDGFVIEQTNKVHKQYEDYNKALADQYKALEDQERQRNEERAAQEEAAKNKAADDATRAIEDAQKKASDVEALRASPQFHKDMREMASQACAFEYWSFCRKVKQRSDLNAKEINDTIDTHRAAISEVSKKNVDAYHLGGEYVSAIIQNAQQRIANTLNSMPSATYRFEHGVCKTTDVAERCHDIGDTWSQPPEETDDDNRPRQRYKKK